MGVARPVAVAAIAPDLRHPVDIVLRRLEPLAEGPAVADIHR